MRRTRKASNTNPAVKNARAFQGLCPALDLSVSVMLEFMAMLSRDLLLRSSFITVALVLSTAAASTAQTAIPRVDGRPNLQGIWQATNAVNDNVGRVVDGGSIPYLPAAAEQRAKNAASRA